MWLEPLERTLLEPELGHIQHQVLFVEQPQNHLFTKKRGQRRYPEIELAYLAAAVHANLDAAVLGKAFFGDVELGNPSDYVLVMHAAATEHISTLLFTEDQTINSGETIDADMQVIPKGTAANIDFENNFILAFTWDLAAIPLESFDIGNAAFTTRMLGLTTRFYDPGLTDYVEFDHDDVDFNITGFQTADINITGITS
ncbi:hypothetical protein LCGC14_2455890, partial [marine sediment metagenome]